jgi:ABC-type lipoprotein export system ATPase subunit/GNAT superfamily N-acetyltransferase
MPRADVTVSSDIQRTARVAQIEGLFDVPAAQRSTVSFGVDANFEERDWNVGLIVGPSGSGKSTIARQLFGDALVERYAWPEDKAIVDGFDTGLSIKDITHALSSCGFASPPAWVRPYQVLSNGERFRSDMARALLDERPLVAIDEFTSVVDRRVGCIGASAIAKSVRAKGKKFVAVTCHEDVLEWLQPDWVIEPHSSTFYWRLLQRRPAVRLEVVRARHDAWRWFHRHHYLSADLHRAARCFVGLVDGDLACFAGVIPFPHPRVRNIWSLSRIVVLPDFQGLGLGVRDFVEVIARTVVSACGADARFTTHPSHPALVKSWARSPLWSMTSAPGFAPKQGKSSSLAPMKHAERRRVAHFRWVGGGHTNEADILTAKKQWAVSSGR